MSSKMLIFLFLGSSLVSFASPTKPSCPTDLDERKAQKNAVTYLREVTSSKDRDISCVDRLLRSLSTDPDAIPTLLEYLDFPAPPSMGRFHANAPILDKFPAVYALATMEGSSEPLLAALATGKLTAEKQHNAVIAYMLANEQDQIGGVKRILAYTPPKEEHEAVAVRMHAVASEAVQQCSPNVRESCLRLIR